MMSTGSIYATFCRTNQLSTILQLIELWETFLMQLDAEDDSLPFYNKTPAVAGSKKAEPTPSRASEIETTVSETQAEVAATATAEQEE